VENRATSSFLLSTAALVVAMVTFLSRSDPQATVTLPATTTLPVTATNTTTIGTATTTPGPAAPIDVPPAAAALVSVMNAQTERAKATASASLEQFKADTSRIKDRLEHTRLDFAARCECYYKSILLFLAFVLVLLLLPRLTNLTFFGAIFTLAPTVPPPLPKNENIMPATAPEAPRLYLYHEVERLLMRRRRPRFVVRVEGEQTVLDSVREVKYHLHPVYGITEHDRTTAPFTLDIPAIGEFLLYADVSMKSGSVIRLQRYLDV
jgi:hypothetical protein